MNTEEREMNRHYNTQEVLENVQDWLFEELNGNEIMEVLINRKALIEYIQDKSRDEYGIELTRDSDEIFSDVDMDVDFSE